MTLESGPAIRALPEPITRIATNSALESVNKIHSPEEARRFGYEGALVPGVTLYAYMTQLALPYLGDGWSRLGRFTVRLLRPVYEGDAVTCSATLREGADPGLNIVCRRPDGTIAADGAAWLDRSTSDPLAGAPELPDIAPPRPLPELTPESIPIGVPLAPLESALTVADTIAYAEETADPSLLWREDSPLGYPLLPPGMIANRQARLLRVNFTFGPSIHAASDIRHLAPTPANATYRTGGVIRETYERNGHHYLVLDALTTADGVPVARIRHTSIYKVRGS
jgi:hypothetical protein